MHCALRCDCTYQNVVGASVPSLSSSAHAQSESLAAIVWRRALRKHGVDFAVEYNVQVCYCTFELCCSVLYIFEVSIHKSGYWRSQWGIMRVWRFSEMEGCCQVQTTRSWHRLQLRGDLTCKSSCGIYHCKSVISTSCRRISGILWCSWTKMLNPFHWIRQTNRLNSGMTRHRLITWWGVCRNESLGTG